jgi:esterase
MIPQYELLKNPSAEEERTMTDLTTVPLHAEVSGEGHPLLLLHGLFGSLSNWRPLSRRFSGSYHVFNLDQRNHGRSPHHDTFNYTALAEDLRAFMRHESLLSAHVLGHSLGGKAAMQLALNYPEAVDKLVVVDMSPLASRPRHREILAALRALDLSAASNRRQLDVQLAQSIASAEMRQFLLMNIANDESGRLQWRMNLDVIAESYDEVNRAVMPQPNGARSAWEKPALFIRGENSDYIQEQDREAIQTLFPHSRLVTVAGAGHWVQADAPEEFANLVLDFLAK